MASLTVAEFERAIRGFSDRCSHLEMRDAYGTEVEVPHMAAWAAGERNLDWLRPWCDDVRSFVAQGRSLRRARVVSEPLSDYQRWSLAIAGPMVDAGEDIRWVPRRLVSSLALPGNDFFLLDDRVVIFLHYSGNGTNTDFVSSTDPHDIGLCGAAFEAVWAVAVAHRDYQAYLCLPKIASVRVRLHVGIRG